MFDLTVIILKLKEPLSKITASEFLNLGLPPLQQ